MPLNRAASAGDHADIAKERRMCTFDTDEMAAELYGGSETLRLKRELLRKVSLDPDFADPVPHAFLSREKRVEETARKTAALMKKAPNLIDLSSKNAGMLAHFLNKEVVGFEGFPLALHFVMFLPALRGQADDEQQAEWLGRALTLEIIGTYAQTELGHGTNLRELETTATFDREKDEFVLHSPTTTSMKWWPGNLGKSSNYAVVVAQLYIDGKCYGPHNFIVQLRDEQTHRPLKGITVGDIGPKFGYNVTDNGFLRFEHFRISRRQMLMRHAKVSREGIYTAPQHAKIGYATMVHVRSVMGFEQGMFLGAACTVAIRYSAVRRQGRIDPKAPEVQILDYQTQQHRLFPQIARAYAIVFASIEIRELYERTLEEIANGNTDLLPDLHALSSGFKSVITHYCGLGIEQCRMACGGHGYSHASGIPAIYATQIGGCTYEGENMVMLLQNARYLVKALDRARAGKPLSPSVRYLADTPKRRSLIGETGSEEGEIDEMLLAIAHAGRRVAVEAAEKLSALRARGIAKEAAWNECAVELTRRAKILLKKNFFPAARLHSRLFIASSLATRARGARDVWVRAALADLLRLHLHYELVDMAAHLMQDGFVNGCQMDYLKKEMYADLEKIRPNAVSLVDSFDMSERELNSVLGRRDGHVYPALYEWAKQSELNYTDVLPAFTKHLKPMMEAGRAASKL